MGSFIKLECHTEENELGVPVKRCVRLHKRLKHCPGMPAETLDESREVLTLAGEEAQLPLPETTTFGASPETSGHGQAATRSQNTGDVGQDLADLLRLADELHEHMLPGGLHLHPEPKPEARPFHVAELQQPRLMDRLRRIWSGRQVTLNKKAWEDYAKDFQEV